MIGPTNGTTTKTEHGRDVQEVVVAVSASASVQFKVVVFDTEGLTATSETYSFALGDLEAPLPATNLFHEVLAVRDVA
jgi:hypothetical protein